ncbi:hypothetical protein ABKN59_002834 [Abortiporus biennis]
MHRGPVLRKNSTCSGSPRRLIKTTIYQDNRCPWYTSVYLPDLYGDSLMRMSQRMSWTTSLTRNETSGSTTPDLQIQAYKLRYQPVDHEHRMHIIAPMPPLYFLISYLHNLRHAFTSRDVDDSDNDFACKTQESENSEVTSASDKWEEFSSEMVEWWLTIRLMSTAAIAATVGALALPEVANNPLLKCLDLVSLTCGACTFVLCIVFANRFSDITFLKSGNQWFQAADDSMERSFLLNAPQLLALPAASMAWTMIFCLVFLTTLFLQITPEPQFALATQIISVVITISAIFHTCKTGLKVNQTLRYSSRPFGATNTTQTPVNVGAHFLLLKR